MHELGIARDFWATIKKIAEKSNLKEITKIIIVVGEAAGVEIDFICHSLKSHILPGTIAENAELEFLSVKLAARCNACSFEITKENISGIFCPSCGSFDINIVSGKEAYVHSIEGE